MSEAAAPRKHYTEAMKERIAELEAEVAALKSNAPVSAYPAPAAREVAAPVPADEREFIDRILSEQGAKMSSKDRAGVNYEKQYSAVRSALATRRLLLGVMSGAPVKGIDALPAWETLGLDPDTAEPIPAGVSYRRYVEGFDKPEADPAAVRPVVEVRGAGDKPRPPPSFNPNAGAPAKVLEVAGFTADPV